MNYKCKWVKESHKNELLIDLETNKRYDYYIKTDCGFNALGKPEAYYWCPICGKIIDYEEKYPEL